MCQSLFLSVSLVVLGSLNRPSVSRGGRHGNNSRPHAKIATASPSQGEAREAAPLPARRTPWQFLRGGENCCHGDRLGTRVRFN